MRIIYKYPIQIVGQQTLFVPRGAKILHANMQDDNAFVWAEVDQNEYSFNKDILIYGTGNTFNEIYEQRYINTFFQGPYVWHCYEVLNENDQKELKF